jgi:hypothetical protein
MHGKAVEERQEAEVQEEFLGMPKNYYCAKHPASVASRQVDSLRSFEVSCLYN